jgi:glycosyltransferase involved in cell wall biosynthesis
VLNCRGSLRESAAYSFALARHQPRVFDAVERFVTPSASARERLAWLGVPRDRIAVVPNYLPQEAFADGSAAADGEYALAAGRIAVEKGFDVAVAAAVESGVPLRIAGDGPAMPALRERAAKAGPKVELLGELERSEFERVLAGAAMLVVPSLSEETFGMSALEAMAAGVPVAAFGLGALPEVVGPEACVPPADVHALAARMSALWDDRERRRAEGEAALARARSTFTEERFTRSLLELYGSS